MDEDRAQPAAVLHDPGPRLSGDHGRATGTGGAGDGETETRSAGGGGTGARVAGTGGDQAAGTGDPAVDEALDVLEAVTRRPVVEHVRAYERAQEVLRDRLADTGA